MGSLKLCHCSVTFDTVKAVMGKDIMTLMLVHCTQKALSLVKIFRRQNGATLAWMTHALVTKVTIFISHHTVFKIFKPWASHLDGNITVETVKQNSNVYFKMFWRLIGHQIKIRSSFIYINQHH